MSPQTLRIALILLCVGLFLSCRQARERTLPDFDTVESIMWAHPDSALALLERMPKPSPDDRLSDATWCLLYTQAWDKNYRRHTSDSLVNIALRYFDKREDGLRKAQVWFYKGSVLKDLGKLEEATECYVRARDLTASFDDPLFASLICQTLGRIYREQDIYGKAFDLFREAIHHVTQVPRSKDWSHAYSELGRTFAERNQLDSARHYFELSLENAELIKDLKMQGMAMGELGAVYRIEKNYIKALEFEKKNLALKLELGDTINFSASRFGVAAVFYRMGELDSAKLYFKESMRFSNISRLRTTNQALFLIAKKQNKFKEATDYIEQYIHYNDSLNNIDRLRAIAEAQEKYDNEKLENEKKSLMLEKERLQRAILRGGDCRRPAGRLNRFWLPTETVAEGATPEEVGGGDTGIPGKPARERGDDPPKTSLDTVPFTRPGRQGEPGGDGAGAIGADRPSAGRYGVPEGTEPGIQKKDRRLCQVRQPE